MRKKVVVKKKRASIVENGPSMMDISTLPKPTSIWSNCDMTSRLKLPKEELRYYYSKHLLLKECTLTDISLYIYSLIFFKKKQIAFEYYENEKVNSFELLNSLEDRFVNGVVSYRLGYIYGNGYADVVTKNIPFSEEFYRNAYEIMNKANISSLSSLELFYIGAIHKDGKGRPQNNEEAVRYYELSAKFGFEKALVNLGCLYRDGDGVKRDSEKAVMYYQKAAAKNYAAGLCHLAYMTEFGYGIKENKEDANKLYILSANLGEKYSIDRCKALNLIYTEKREDGKKQESSLEESEEGYNTQDHIYQEQYDADLLVEDEVEDRQYYF